MQSADVERVANMLGALAVAIEDLVQAGSRDAALVSLHSHPARSVAELSRALGRSHSATVRLVDGMVAAGLLERRSGADSRSVSLVLSAEGAAAARDVRSRRADALDQLVRALDGEHVEQLEPILEQLLEATATDADSRWRTCRLCDEPRCEDGRQCPVDRAAPR
jgi:MarR family transcriptional regulator, negative regulator of the multidrug operon emrRAB